MKLIIEPYLAVGQVKLGMTIEEIHGLLGTPDRSFQNREFYRKPGMYIHYIKPGVCEFIELVKPARPEFQGQKLLGKPFNQIVDWFKERDSEAAVDSIGSMLTSKKFGIALYAEGASKRPSKPVESVSVFERGYYDNHSRRKLRIDLDKYKKEKLRQ